MCILVFLPAPRPLLVDDMLGMSPPTPPSIVPPTRRLSLNIYHCPWKDAFLIILIRFSASDSSQTGVGEWEISRSLGFSKNELGKRSLFLPVRMQSQCVSKATGWEVIVKRIIEVKVAKPPPMCVLHFCLCGNAEASDQDTVNPQMEMRFLLGWLSHCCSCVSVRSMRLTRYGSKVLGFKTPRVISWRSVWDFVH